MSKNPSKDGSEQKRLPFEPAKSRQKPENKRSPSPATPKSSRASSSARPSASAGIPEVVSRRMLRRMALFCGIPTLLGLSSFFVSYYVVSHELFKLPNTAVLFGSLGFFGLGIAGLSYGALSASWDESSPGGLLGWREFTTNLGRMQQAWREARQQSKSS